MASLSATLRGGDEPGIVLAARSISESPFGSDVWGSALIDELHKFVLATQFLAFDSPDLALRITHAGIAVAGIALFAVAVYELAGPRAAVIAAWVLALEPAGVFFAGVLHKEAILVLAGGLVAFGGARVWKHGQPRALLPIVLGCLIAVATRPYAGWFLIAAGAAVTLHAGLRSQHRESLRAVSLVSIVILFGALAAPTVWEASTNESLEKGLGHQSEAESSQGANLNFENVDFTTREQIIVNLPKRIHDVIVLPYPWQMANASQRFAVIGTLITWLVLILLGREIWRNRRKAIELGAPLFYMGVFLLVAYSLSAANAGTAFRYRTHIVVPALCLLVVLWVARQRRAAAEEGGLEAPAPAAPLEPAPHAGGA
jgi:hypothetical protein